MSYKNDQKKRQSPLLLMHWCSTFFVVFTISASWAAEPDFQRDIRPILSNTCFKCHGPDDHDRKGGSKKAGGLRLDTEAGSRFDHDDSRAVVPGHPEQSELIARIITDDEDDIMPPKKSGPPLSKKDIALLTAWVKSGGKYAQHWSYVQPQRIDPPLPTKNPIDAFIRAQLEKDGLQPQGQAEKTTLIRRLALDVIGLPPTLAEIDAFVNDTKPDAYERLVDYYLSSPAYGEHWGRLWLDLARYADSAGYADDPLRTIWPYRDYVIRSFNDNKPFDQFTIEQLAGDLLPNPTDEQLTATAFHRNTMTNSEGGTQDEEFRNAAIVDRVNTTMEVWMGTSIACAQCHTHKYDPITNEEYFRLFAFFNNTEDADRRDESPLHTFFSDEQKSQRAVWESEIAQIEKTLTTPTPQLEKGAQAWAQKFPVHIAWQTLKPQAVNSEAGKNITAQADNKIVVAAGAKTDSYTISSSSPTAQTISALRLEALSDASLPQQGPGHANGNFVITHIRADIIPAGGAVSPRGRYVRIELTGADKILQLAEVQVFAGSQNIAQKGKATQKSTFEKATADKAIDGKNVGEYDKGSVAHTDANTNDPWWEVDLKSEQAIDRIVVWNRTEESERLAGFRLVILDDKRKTIWEKADNPAPKKNAAFTLHDGKTITFNEAIADYVQSDFNVDDVLSDAPTKPTRGKKKPGELKPGWAIGGSIGQSHDLTLLADKPVTIPAGAQIIITIDQQSEFANHTLGHFRLSVTNDAGVGEHVRAPIDVQKAFAAAETQRSPEQRAAIITYYLQDIAPELAGERKTLANLQRQLSEMKPVTVPIFRELEGNKRRKTHIQIRGNYLVTGEEVNEGVPAAFPPLPKDAPRNRLTFAHWLVDGNNPLTARVITNRYWETIFGIGLVRTSEEFGAQGELPSNPALLDYLATEFVRNKWDVKKIIKLLVTSETYKQSSRVSPQLAERDPDNRLLARGPRVRLSAETIRDNALAVSGLLSAKMYGPSVRPVRPELGLKAAFGGGLDWKTSSGEDRYRRALYTEWRRTSPYPSLQTFDAPSRETCTLRRNRTNTPLQAFVTMNDPVYVETAQALARLMVKQGKIPSEIITFGFRKALARKPSASELARLNTLYNDALTHFKTDEKKATDMATDPIGSIPPETNVVELAAWTTVASVLLNLDETLLKR